MSRSGLVADGDGRAAARLQGQPDGRHTPIATALAASFGLLLACLSMLAPAAADASEPACPGSARGVAAVAWGANGAEDLAAGFKSGAEPAPNTVQSLTGIVEAKTGFQFGLAIVNEGAHHCALRAWGFNREGELGNGEKNVANHPVAVRTLESGHPELTNVREVAPVGGHATALRYDGTVWTWGAAEFGERGNGESNWERVARASDPNFQPRVYAYEVAALMPQTLGEGRHVKQIAVGGKREYALLENGEVLAWGENRNDELGVGSTSEKCFGELYASTPVECSTTPRPVLGTNGTGTLKNVERIAAGFESAYAVLNGGKEVVSWGYNAKGQLGNGTTVDSTHPVTVKLTPSSRVAEIAGGREYALARLEDGTVYAWGGNNNDQLGFESGSLQSEKCGAGACAPTPVRVTALSHVIGLAASEVTSLALKEEANEQTTIYTFGQNGFWWLLGLGEVGFTQESTVATPTPIKYLSSPLSVALSGNTGLAVLGAAGPAQLVQLTPLERALKLSWLVPSQNKYKVRIREVGTPTGNFTPIKEVAACPTEPTCAREEEFKENRKGEPLRPEPYEANLTIDTGKVKEGHEQLKVRKVFGTPLPPAGAPVNSQLPTIAAGGQEAPHEVHEGQVLSVSSGVWQPAASKYVFTWLRCLGRGEGGTEEDSGSECVEVGTGEQHTAGAEDLGSTIEVKVVGENSQGWSAAVTPYVLVVRANEEDAEPPQNLSRPSIAVKGGGGAVVGSTFEAKPGSWEGNPIATEVKWLRCREQIKTGPEESTGGNCGIITTAKGEQITGAEYTATAEDGGKWIEVQERATTPGGYTTLASYAIEVSAPPVNTTPPSIAGTVGQGQLLTGQAGQWENASSKPERHWQWWRCPPEGACAAILTATTQNYRVNKEDANETLEVSETVVNAVGTRSEPAFSARTAPVPAPSAGETAVPQATSKPSLSGNPKSGETLTVIQGTYTGEPQVREWEWRRCSAEGKECKTIAGAHNQTYVLTAADVNHTVKVWEMAWNAYGKAKSESALTAVITPTAPTLEPQNPPKITGSAQQGQTLTASPGAWTQEPTTYRYQWLRCDGAGEHCGEIAGAAAPTYEPGAQDIEGEHELRVRVIAENSAGPSEPAISAPTGVVLIAAPANVEPPQILGSENVSQGSELRVKAGAWSPEPETSGRSYQWQRCEAGGCSNIAGAKASTYVPTSADVGFTLAVKETATNAGGWTSATSQQTAVVKAVPPPTVTALEPASGSTLGHTTVTITGTHLAGASAVKFGGQSALKYETVSETSIRAESPSSASGTIDVTVTTAGGTSTTGPGDRFEFVPPPAVTRVEPSSGSTAGGTVVTITGTNLSGASAVRFGFTGATIESVTSTSITARSPQEPIAGTVDVTVTTPYGTSATGGADQFKYVAPPTIAGVEPNAGATAGKNVVIISGAGFTGASRVKFGSANALTYTVLNDGSIQAESPAGTGTVDVTVTTPYGSSAPVASDRFTYYPPPTVTKLKPAAGPVGGGTSVEITGTNFIGATAVRFGATGATSFKVVNATTITASSPAHEAGYQDVTVATPGGTSAVSTADRFKYEPAITSVSPVSGTILGGTSVTIHGEGFATSVGATKFKFGTTLAPTVTCASSSECTAVSPPHEAGAVDVRATVSAQTSPKVSADLYTYF